MNARTIRSLTILPLLTLVSALALSACGSATETLTEARPTVGATAAPDSPTSGSDAPIAAPSPAATAEPTVEPTASPEPVADAIILGSGFSQSGKSIGFGIALENPNATAALEGVTFQLVAYGEGDLVLGTDESTIPVLPPGVNTFYGGSTYLDAEQPVQRIDVQITDGGEAQPATPEELPPFTVEATTFRESTISKQVSAVVVNPFTIPLDNLYVGIVLYDEADQIIGGGFTFLPFLLPEGRSPFVANVEAGATPARIEISPLVSVLTLLGQREAGEMPSLTLIEQGWGQDRQIGFGVVVENPDQEQALESSQYLVAAYAEDGVVLGVSAGYFGVILPGGRAAQGGSIFLPDNTIVPARVEALIFPGSLIDATGKKPFRFEGVNFVPGDFSAKATGQFTNPYDQPIKSVEISAIIRNVAGQIVGGGSNFSDTIPASGKAAVEISVTTSEDGATAEIYGAEVAITKIGE